MGFWDSPARGERPGRPPGVGSLRVVLVGTLVLVLGLLVATFASASRVEPVPGPTNPQTRDCPTGSVGWKYEPVESGTVGDGTLSVTVTVNDTSAGETFDFSSNLPIVTVFVKGGPVSNKYVYDPAVTSDTGLHAPVNPNSGKYYGLSHIVFCYSAKGTIVVEKRTEPAGDPHSFAFTSSFAGDFSLSHGATKEARNLSPGTYAVSETVPTGWDLTSATCSDGSPPSAISLQAGETVTCTFVNTKRGRIVVRKETKPEGANEKFSFTASWGSFTLADGGEADSGLLRPGTYSVSESVPEGWSLESASCDDGSSPSAIGLSAGETVTCTFVNVEDGEIVVEKQTVPDGYRPPGGPFVFTGAIEARLGDGESASRRVAPGTYTVTEVERAFWDVEIVCNDGDSSGDNEQRTATYRVDPGELVTCVFTNTKRSLIIVRKVTDPEGAEQRFGFDPSWGEDNFALADGEQHVSRPLRPGTYSVRELPVEGWELESATCSNGDDPSEIELPASTVVTCTFRNVERKPEPGTIIVKKRTNPAGDETKFEFTFGPAGSSSEGEGEVSGASSASFSLADGEQEVLDGLEAGTYSVSEDVPEGWDLTSAVCDDGSDPSAIELSAGEAVTCVFENTKLGTIVVRKVTDPEGAKERFGFDPSWGEDNFTLADGEEHVSPLLRPETYSVAELPVEGWELEDATCDDGSEPSAIELSAGETVTCTFTNAEEKARLTLVKEVVNDDGGTAAARDFTLRADGPTVLTGAGGAEGEVDAGTYVLSESGPSGYEASEWTCDGGSLSGSELTLTPGESATCTITNDDRPATLIVRKVVVNDDGGTKTASDFSFQLNGSAAQPFEVDGENVLVLDAGTYTVTEVAAQGYTTTYSGCSNVVIPNGGSATCTITNNDVPKGIGAIEVSKSASPTSVKEPGGSVTYTVTIRNVSEVLVRIENVVDDRFGDLDDAGGSGCFDVPVSLAPGASTFCQFTRNVTGAGRTSHVNVVTASGVDASGNPVFGSDDARVDITPRLIDLVVEKTATSPTPLNGTVTYTLTVTNRGPDTATSVQLADPAPAGVQYQSASASQGTCTVTAALVTCSLGTIAPGQVVTVTVTGRATATGTHVNTATVSGQGGRETNPADNTDSAQTVVPAPLKPPSRPSKPSRPKPPAVAADICLALTVSPSSVTADGKPDHVRTLVTAGKKRMPGVRVVIRGPGVARTGRTNERGVAVVTINPRRAGILTITAQERNREICGAKRIGAVGVFLPPVTG
ncbi:MAG: DUF11 domain-containing protein [Gaiellaceae bacterium]|nr:DUF11 domain-containing protein [Gaiellaceae bacterium]